MNDTALANLDASLDRRPPPADAAEALSAFPHGLTTAEVAAILRPVDLVDADLLAAERQLTLLIGDRGVVCEPVGSDALWRLPRPSVGTAEPDCDDYRGPRQTSRIGCR